MLSLCVIASEAKQSRQMLVLWIASSFLLAMTRSVSNVYLTTTF